MLSPDNLVGTLVSAGGRLAAFVQDGSAIRGLGPLVYETDPNGVVEVTDGTTLEACRTEHP